MILEDLRKITLDDVKNDVRERLLAQPHAINPTRGTASCAYVLNEYELDEAPNYTQANCIAGEHFLNATGVHPDELSRFEGTGAAVVAKFLGNVVYTQEAADFLTVVQRVADGAGYASYAAYTPEGSDIKPRPWGVVFAILTAEGEL